MERKKWTPQLEISESHLKFREKRRWQLALRRYVLEKNISANYAVYFGLSIEQMRVWIELQFSGGLNWENFGTSWQFEHIVPVSYFNFSSEEDLRLCWNFINIRVECIDLSNKQTHLDVIAAKSYFETLYKNTAYSLCLQMIEKITKLEALHTDNNPAIVEFIIKNRPQLEILSSLKGEEFNNLNRGLNLDEILLEREIIKKFG